MFLFIFTFNSYSRVLPSKLIAYVIFSLYFVTFVVNLKDNSATITPSLLYLSTNTIWGVYDCYFF